ncbi:MAG: plasmid mobilization protein [Thiomonas sp.]
MRERTIMLSVRVLPQEATLIRHAALAAGVSVSAWLRAAALREDPRIARLNGLHAELRRQGGLLKHLSAQGALSAQATAQALADWQRAVRSIAQEIAHAGQGLRP